MLDQRAIQRAIQLLKQNQVVILPTDTIYGLSAKVNLANEKRINQLKNSPVQKPLIILFSAIQQVDKWVDLDEKSWNLLSSIIPTTVIVATKNSAQTLAIRLVKRRDIKSIIDAVGPIYSTSVNFHQGQPLNDQTSLTSFNPEVSVFFDGISENQPSKIFNTVTKKWVR